MSKPIEVLPSKRVCIKDKNLENYYLIFCYEDERDEFSDNGFVELWANVPNENKNMNHKSDAQAISCLLTLLRKDYDCPVERIIHKLDKSVCARHSVSGIILKAIKDHGLEEG